MLLASIGVYGVLSLNVKMRTREMGLRLALGAEPRSILVMIVRQGLGLVAIGIVLGLATASALAQFVSTFWPFRLGPTRSRDVGSQGKDRPR